MTTDPMTAEDRAARVVWRALDHWDRGVIGWGSRVDELTAIIAATVDWLAAEPRHRPIHPTADTTVCGRDSRPWPCPAERAYRTALAAGVPESELRKEET